ncbi:unnamed protein product [Gongylonema pulchrum]|uniref:Protein kinase domain-containing protein n=1 Tax=Gongylonema pulchrum TaxID=637853 RepID=A0A183E5H2_9BILA|nr:unnamed protein product [Gongylonema pulchrum]
MHYNFKTTTNVECLQLQKHVMFENEEKKEGQREWLIIDYGYTETHAVAPLVDVLCGVPLTNSLIPSSVIPSTDVCSFVRNDSTGLILNSSTSHQNSATLLRDLEAFQQMKVTVHSLLNEQPIVTEAIRTLVGSLRDVLSRKNLSRRRKLKQAADIIYILKRTLIHHELKWSRGEIIAANAGAGQYPFRYHSEMALSLVPPAHPF